MLRTQPLAAGLDPRFTVLDEAAARRLATSAFEAALDAWTAERGAPAVDLAAAYAWDLELLITQAHSALRSRGATHPRLALPPEAPPPDPSALAAAAAAASAALRVAPGGARVNAAVDALEACTRLIADPAARRRTRLRSTPRRCRAARRRSSTTTASPTAAPGRRTASACADHHARPAVVLLDALLDTFGRRYARGQARARRRRLRGPRAARPRPARRRARAPRPLGRALRADHGRRVPGHEPAAARHPRGAGARQPVRGRRRVAVDLRLPPRRRRHLPGAQGGAGRRRGAQSHRQLQVEVGDPRRRQRGVRAVAGQRASPQLVAGRAPEELRLFEPDPPEEPGVELLAVDTAGWDEHEDELGLAALATQPWRRAEARAVAARLRAEVDAGRPQRDVVVLVRATSSLRLYEQALEEQGLSTYVVGGRGYWAQEQVRDGLAYLGLLANPYDEAALYAALSSPFCGVGTDALALLAEAGRRDKEGAWAALRRAASGGEGWLGDLPVRRGRRGSSRSPASRPASGCAPSASRSRCCSSARSRPPATTSRSSPAPAATGGSPTCAS